MNVNQLIIDYVHTCDKRCEVLDLSEFIPLWTVANEIAQQLASEERLRAAPIRRRE